MPHYRHRMYPNKIFTIIRAGLLIMLADEAGRISYAFPWDISPVQTEQPQMDKPLCDDKYDLLINAYRPELPILKRHKCVAKCIMTGEGLTEGYKVADVIDKTTTGQAELFRTNGAFLGERAVRLLRASKLLRGNLLAMPDKGLRPMVSLSSATEERPAWRDLVRTIAIGTPTIAIVSGEFQRRLWHLAPLSYFGASWRPFCNFDDECRAFNIDVSKLRGCLDLIEEIYAAGFSKISIKNGLLDSSAIKIVRLVGFSKTKQYEERLKSWRNSDEFKLAVFIAQREEKDNVHRTESALAETEVVIASIAS